MEILITCKEGSEKLLGQEAALYDGKLQAKGNGWVFIQWANTNLEDLCFAYHTLINPLKVSATSVNALTEKLLDVFTTHIKDKRIEGPWPFLFTSGDSEQLLQRVQTVKENWQEKLKKKMSRVAKLGQEGIPPGPPMAEGFFVYFNDFGEAFVSFWASGARQKRMQMDEQAPSRSYLKIEEAFCLFGCRPEKGDTVIDLGAAPGGWSYSALKQGASVLAVDNGPLKGPVASHPKIKHLKVDAFKFEYKDAQPADWLLSDILDKPEIVLELLHKWLSRHWCRCFIVNLKVGRTDPLPLLKNIRDPKKGIAPLCARLEVKQLYHDREEITLMGEVQV